MSTGAIGWWIELKTSQWRKLYLLRYQTSGARISCFCWLSVGLPIHVCPIIFCPTKAQGENQETYLEPTVRVWNHTADTYLPLKQLRVTAARPGVVNFELPIEKHHTVSASPLVPSYYQYADTTPTEPSQYPPRRNHSQYGRLGRFSSRSISWTLRYRCIYRSQWYSHPQSPHCILLMHYILWKQKVALASREWKLICLCVEK
jgi:hypothetical protein